MASNVLHSPLPWKTYGDAMVFDAIGSDIGEFVGDHTSTDEDIANTRFIIKAVNSYYPMRKALESIREDILAGRVGITVSQADISERCFRALISTDGENSTAE